MSNEIFQRILRKSNGKTTKVTNKKISVIINPIFEELKQFTRNETYQSFLTTMSFGESKAFIYNNGKMNYQKDKKGESIELESGPNNYDKFERLTIYLQNYGIYGDNFEDNNVSVEKKTPPAKWCNIKMAKLQLTMIKAYIEKIGPDLSHEKKNSYSMTLFLYIKLKEIHPDDIIIDYEKILDINGVKIINNKLIIDCIH